MPHCAAAKLRHATLIGDLGGASREQLGRSTSVRIAEASCVSRRSTVEQRSPLRAQPMLALPAIQGDVDFLLEQSGQDQDRTGGKPGKSCRLIGYAAQLPDERVVLH